MKRILSLLLLLSFAFCVGGCQTHPSGSSDADGVSWSASSRSSATRDSAATRDHAATLDHIPGSSPDQQASSKPAGSEIITHPKDVKINPEYFTRPLMNRAAELHTEPLLQNPELPTGCESVALTDALCYLHFDLQKTDFAEKYLTYGEDVMWDYVGDPTDYDGAGIYPPGLTNCANAYLAEQKSPYVAYNTMGTAFDDLLKLIDAGYPVVLWTTMDYEEPILGDVGYEYEGTYYLWFELEHCVMLCGYDLDMGTVTLNDPLQGVITVELEQMKKVYDGIGRLSMTVKDPR